MPNSSAKLVDARFLCNSLNLLHSKIKLPNLGTIPLSTSLSLPALPISRLPHPLRFSKGGVRQRCASLLAATTAGGGCPHMGCRTARLHPIPNAFIPLSFRAKKMIRKANHLRSRGTCWLCAVRHPWWGQPHPAVIAASNDAHRSGTPPFENRKGWGSPPALGFLVLGWRSGSPLRFRMQIDVRLQPLR